MTKRNLNVDGSCSSDPSYTSQLMCAHSCISAGRVCGGYSLNPKPWIFDPGAGVCKEGSENEGPGQHLDGRQSLPSTVLSMPYRTREDQVALQFWLKMTTEMGSDHPGNALYRIFGALLPQAAWYCDAVRHSLISAASTALALEARASGMNTDLQVSLSKQSVIQMRLAIHDLVKETEPSTSTILAITSIFIVCMWTGRWNEFKRHVDSCCKLIRPLQMKGEYIDEDLIICLNTLVKVVNSFPSTSVMTKSSRFHFTCSIMRSTKFWIDSLIPSLEQRHASETLKTVLRCRRVRINWILNRWQADSQPAEQTEPVCLEQSPFGEAVRHMEGLKKDCPDFDFTSFETALTLAFKVTLIYGAGGDAQRLRDAAIASHAPLPLLKLYE